MTISNTPAPGRLLQRARVYAGSGLFGIIGAAAILVSSPAAVHAQQPSAALSKKSPEAAELSAVVKKSGKVNVIVGFAAPAASAKAQASDEERAAAIADTKAKVAAMQDAIIRAHLGSAQRAANNPKNISRFAITPGFSATVTQAELQALAADPRVTRIEINRLDQPHLLDSVPLIGMADVYADGFTGNGQAVAVLDTGAFSAHEFLSGKVIAEACFSNGGVAGGNTLCPNGQGSQTGAGATNPTIANCDDAIASICYHGTHVAGIAAGRNTAQVAGFPTNGVAKGAKIFAIQVFTRNGDTVGAFVSDQILALEHVLANLTLPGGVKVAAINMSLGNITGNTTPCDMDSRKTVIDNLRAAGVLTVISSGNFSYTNAGGSPGCISTALTVGATDKSDVIAAYSNMSTMVDVMAPGGSDDQVTCMPGVHGSNVIVGPGVDLAHGTHTYFCLAGTSMAAPHVAGAVAVLKSACPLATADQIENALKTTGTPIVDGRAGGTFTKPRIRVSQALDALDCVPIATATTTTVASSDATSVFGQSVNLVAKVSAAAGTPAGSVVFKDGAVVLGTKPIVAGRAVLPVPSLAVRAHNIRATYNGNASFKTSTSAILRQTVAKGATITAKIIASPAAPVAGKAVTLTAAVTAKAPAKGTPTGGVTFKDGTKILGTKAIVSGKATLKVTSFAAGSHSLTATYVGNANFATSKSVALALTVKKTKSNDTEEDETSDPGEIANETPGVLTTSGLAPVVDPGNAER